MAVGEKKLRDMQVDLPFSALEGVLSQVVTGDFFGADRIDYLLRDAQCTGVSYGLFDYHQLIEMLSIVSYEGQLQLAIEENGIESCEALLRARHFMHQRVYQYSSVKAYKFHLARFMQQFFQGKSYLDSLGGYLSLTDCEIISAWRYAAKDPSAAGHADAISLMRREKRFKAVQLKEEVDLAELKEIPSDALFYELGSLSKANKELSFPVLTKAGALIPARELSQIVIPARTIQWAYVAPEYEKRVRGAIERWG
jgi:HD superfamily phosphohydrolase